MTTIEEQAKKIQNWNCENIEELLVLIFDLQGLLLKYEDDPRKIDDLIDFSSLPSIPFPDEIAPYPVWAMDTELNCLVGDSADTVESLKEILEFHFDSPVLGPEKYSLYGSAKHSRTNMGSIPEYIKDEGYDTQHFGWVDRYEVGSTGLLPDGRYIRVVEVAHKQGGPDSLSQTRGYYYILPKKEDVVTISVYGPGAKIKKSFEAKGFGIVGDDPSYPRIVKSQGTSGGVYVPRDWIGSRVVVIRLD